MIPINKPQTRDVLLHVTADSGIILTSKLGTAERGTNSSARGRNRKDEDQVSRPMADYIRTPEIKSISRCWENLR